MGSTADLRSGTIIKYNGENCIILEHFHVTPGKGPAHHSVKMRNLRTGKLSEGRFRSNENVDLVRVDKKEFQYIYNDGDNYYFMDTATYEQIPVNFELLDTGVNYLKENQEVKIAFEGDEILSVEFPASVVLRVTHAEPGLRGDTATNVTKPATVETGLEVQVPLFINEGDLIKVDTSTGKYSERVKE